MLCRYSFMCWVSCHVIVKSGNRLHKWLKIFLGLGLTVTEINIKKVQRQEIKNVKNVKGCRDGCQKVYKQGRNDSIKAKVNIKAIPHPYTSFSHCSLTDSMA